MEEYNVIVDLTDAGVFEFIFNEIVFCIFSVFLFFFFFTIKELFITKLTKLTLLSILPLITITDYITPALVTILSCN